MNEFKYESLTDFANDMDMKHNPAKYREDERAGFRGALVFIGTTILLGALGACTFIWLFGSFFH